VCCVNRQAKQQQLIQERRKQEEEKLLTALASPMGFHKGKPLAALVVFRACLQWRAFQADRTSVFDRIIQVREQQDRLEPGACCSLFRQKVAWQGCCVPPYVEGFPHVDVCLLSGHVLQVIGSQIERQQDDNACLAYWLTNTVTLLHLLQRNIKPASGSTGSVKRVAQAGRSLMGGLFGRQPGAGGSAAHLRARPSLPQHSSRVHNLPPWRSPLTISHIR
jgi:myosin-5